MDNSFKFQGIQTEIVTSFYSYDFILIIAEYHGII